MQIVNEIKLNFDDVLIKPKRSTLQSRKDVDLQRIFNFKYSPMSWTGVPIIASNMDTVGTPEASWVMDEHKMMTWLHKFVDYEDIEMFHGTLPYTCAPSIGEGEDPHHYWGDPQVVRIDVANGYRESFVSWVREFRKKWPRCIIFAGNVCTPEQTEELILAGADVVVVGIGGGGQCTTRIKSGVGYPQLSAVIECADAAHGLGGHIVSDGGCRTPGDIAKAFGAGADFVSLGSMLAGHDENTADENYIFEEGRIIGVKIYGMSSNEAMEKYYGGVDDWRTDEGRSTIVPYRGPLANTLKDILGGLRSACTYVGAKRLKELSKRTTFIRTNQVLNDYWVED